MSLESKIISLAQAVGADIKTLTTNQGSLSSLTTTAKGNFVAALNELKASLDALSQINDLSTDTDSTWSSTKISSAISTAVSAVVNSSPAALDTLKELADALGSDANFSTTIATQMGLRVRFDSAQVLTVPQQLQVCTNIGIGDPEHNFVTEYTAAKA